MAGVMRQEIKALKAGCQNSIVIGVIMSSANPKTFESRQQKFGSGGVRGVWSFTMRDSVEDMINVTVWGSVEYINRMFRMYRIGSVVEVISGKVMSRQKDDRNEEFAPCVNSDCTLTVNEGLALIQAHDSPAYSRYEALLRVPTVSTTELRPLKYVLDNLENLNNHYVNILVIVTFVGQAQDTMTRDGRRVLYRDIEITDDSTEETHQLRFWEEELIRISEFWEPKKTTLFIVDARVTFNKYKKKLCVTIVKRSIIIENPNVPEVSKLKENLISRPGNPHNDPYMLPNPNCITTKMTIQEITAKLHEHDLPPEKRLQFFTVLYARVTDVNLNEYDKSYLYKKCALCKRSVKEDYDSCMNMECPCGIGAKTPINVVKIVLKVNLKDDTGYLINCRLSGAVAEQALGHSAEEIGAMNMEKLQQVKWDFVLQHFEIRLQVVGPTAEFKQTIYNILSMKKVLTDDEETLNDLLNISSQEFRSP